MRVASSHTRASGSLGPLVGPASNRRVLPVALPRRRWLLHARGRLTTVVANPDLDPATERSGGWDPRALIIDPCLAATVTISAHAGNGPLAVADVLASVIYCALARARAAAMHLVGLARPRLRPSSRRA
jgi:hypothetical protein